MNLNIDGNWSAIRQSTLLQLSMYRKDYEMMERLVQDPFHLDPRWLLIGLMTLGRNEEALRYAESLGAENDRLIKSLMAALYELNGKAREAGRLRFEIIRDDPLYDLRPDLPNLEPGQDISGKTVVIWTGGLGAGDDILYSRYFHLVADRGAKVILQCQPDMIRLMRAVPGVSEVTHLADLPDGDLSAHFQEVPHLLGMTKYIPPAGFDVKPLNLPDEKFKIGLFWGCSINVPHGQQRHCELAELKPLSDIPGISLYSLQKGTHAKQLLAPPAGMTLIDLAPHIRDYLDTAAFITAMDLIVATDSSVANLAASLGKPVMVLSPLACDFRWLNDGELYPSANPFIQTTHGVWNDVIIRMCEAVRVMRCYSSPHTQLHE